MILDVMAEIVRRECDREGERPKGGRERHKEREIGTVRERQREGEMIR